MAEHAAERHTAEANYVLPALEFFARMGSAEAIVHGVRRYTYAETRAAVLAMATALNGHGISGDMTVIAVTRNHPESIILQLALHLLGCRTGFVPAWQPTRDQIGFIEHAGADVLIHDSGLAGELISGAQARAGRPVLSLGPEASRPDLLAEMVIAAAGSQPDGERAARAAADYEPQALFHTGGTTGPPKLVLHRQRFYRALLLTAELRRGRGEPAVRHLGISSLATTTGQMSALLTLFQGGTALLMTAFGMAEFLAAIERERVTSTFLTPVRLREVLTAPALARTDCSSLRYLYCGGSPTSRADLAQAIERFGPVLRVAYGMTEAPLIAEYPVRDIDPAHPERLRSCGKAFATGKIEVRGEDGAVLPAGGTGEVWVAGPLLMAGYPDQPDLTGQVLVDGWLRTGDIGYADADGYLYLVDRSADAVITGTPPVRVYSRPAEEVLATHPGVRAAAVIGVPDTERGEAVHAFVVRSPGTGVTAAELRDLVAGELGEPSAPREVHFVAELPMTSKDTIDKQALRARYQDR